MRSGYRGHFVEKGRNLLEPLVEEFHLGKWKDRQEAKQVGQNFNNSLLYARQSCICEEVRAFCWEKFVFRYIMVKKRKFY